MSGFSLVEVLVALTILGIMMGAVLTLSSNSLRLLDQQKISATQGRITDNIAHMVSMPATLRASTFNSEFNAELANCVFGGTHPCQANGAFIPVRLNMPLNVPLDSNLMLSSAAITGTPTLPVLFNDRGEICDPYNSACSPSEYPLQAITEFNAVCPAIYDSSYDLSLRGGSPYYGPIYPNGLVTPSVCPLAKYIRIRLTIQPSITGMPSLLTGGRKTVQIFPVDATAVRTPY